MDMKDKNLNKVLNALKCLDEFTDCKLEEIKIGLSNANRKDSLLRELQLPIKKARLVQKVKLCNVAFDTSRILQEENLSELIKIEKLISLEILKNTTLKTINDKKLPISKSIIQNIVAAKSIDDLNQKLNDIPYPMRVHIVKIKSRESKSVSVVPIYTPMGNKR